MRPVRTAVTTTASLLGIAAIALTLTGCMCAVTTSIAGPTRMNPGQTADFTVMEQGETGMDTIFAVGRGATDGTKEENGRGRREVRIVVTVGDSAAPEEQSFERPAVAPTGPTVKILEVGNGYGVSLGGSAPSFAIDKPAYVIDITTYHFIEGGGPTPGTLGLKGSDGKTHGPWPCKGVDGQGGVKNAFWVATPNELLPAGTYTIVDSDPGTWSTNDRAKGVGFATVNVVYAK